MTGESAGSIGGNRARSFAVSLASYEANSIPRWKQNSATKALRHKEKLKARIKKVTSLIIS
jgi:hypothetical protein